MSVYTTNLLLENPTPADPAVTDLWPAIMNTGRSLTDSAVAGVLSLSVAGSSDVVLTSLQGAADQARNAHFFFTGTLTGDITVFWPNGLGRMFSVTNNTTGAYTLTIAANDGGGSPAGDTIDVDQGVTALLASDGTDIFQRAPQVGFYTFTGPTSTTKTFTLPDASDTIACLGQTNAFTKQQYFALTTLTDASSISWDVGSNQAAKVTLGGNRTLSNPTNAQAGATYNLIVIQDGTGSRTLAYGANYKWPGGIAPTLSTAAAAIDVLSFLYDGTSMLGVAQRSFA